jgi:DNA mismatch repair ATPase MutL
MYILLEGEEELLLVDQHALAERITFEKMRKEF